MPGARLLANRLFFYLLAEVAASPANWVWQLARQFNSPIMGVPTTVRLAFFFDDHAEVYTIPGVIAVIAGIGHYPGLGLGQAAE